jgi:hypothetical protein
MWLFENRQSKNLNCLQKINPVIQSYFGHFKHANSYRLQQQFINELFKLNLSRP